MHIGSMAAQILARLSIPKQAVSFWQCIFKLDENLLHRVTCCLLRANLYLYQVNIGCGLGVELHGADSDARWRGSVKS